MNTDRHGWGSGAGQRVHFSSLLACVLAVTIPAVAVELPRDTNGQIRLVVQPIVWPTDGMVTPKGREILKEERRVFADELRHLKEWVPDNMRGATSKLWVRGGKTMLSESHAIDHVPDMPTEQVEKIIAEMEEGAADTPLDNLERFQQALSKRIPVFAKGRDQYKAGEYGKAAETVHKPLTTENVLHAFFLYQYDTLPPFIYCVVTFFEGECYGRDGALHDAMVRYWMVKGKLPACLSLSATARIRLADMYEKTEREHFAIPFYQKTAETYVECLSDTEILRLYVRARKMMEENTFRRTIACGDDIARHMDRLAYGAVVQESQTELLKRMKMIVSDYEGDGRGNLQINWEMMGSEIQRAGLQEGASPTKLTFKKDVAATGSDDWAKLRPREKQEVIQKFYESYPPEYRNMIEDYFRTMSREETGGRSKGGM